MLNALIVIRQRLLKVSKNKLLKEHIKIWGKVGSLLKIEFDGEAVYGDNDKYKTTKIKLYGDKININV